MEEREKRKSNSISKAVSGADKVVGSREKFATPDTSLLPSPIGRRKPIHHLFIPHVYTEPFCILGPMVGGGELEMNKTEMVAVLLGWLCAGKTDIKHITLPVTM